MGPEWLDLLAMFLAYVAVTWAALRLPTGSGAVQGLVSRKVRAARHLLPRGSEPEPTRRPIELIARDARRFGSRFHHPPRGTSFAKVEAMRHAYDRVLVEACHALGVEQLLEVLPPGEELDAERTRVEGLLWLAGLRIDEVA